MIDQENIGSRYVWKYDNENVLQSSVYIREVSLLIFMCLLIPQAFLKRHSDISVRVPERVSKARASITEKDIRTWFTDLENNLKFLGVEDVLKDPTRVFNTDETCIQLAPSTGKVIGETKWRNIYEVAPGAEKSTLTFLGTFSASGEMPTPMIIYPYQRLPKDIGERVPDDFLIGTSESGWMRSETFYEFMANAFIPWVDDNGIKKPVILFIDGHKTHVSLQVSALCEERQVILYLLPPNTTHILQPADVGAFRPLKHYWRQEVKDFQNENPNSVVRRRDVAPMIKKALSKIPKTAIVNGFRACDLCPLNPDNVDYAKCLDVEVIHTEETSPRPNSSSDNPTQDDIKTTLNVLNYFIGEKTINDCRMGQSVNVDFMELVKKITTYGNEPRNENKSSTLSAETLDVVDQNSASIISMSEQNDNDIDELPDINSNPLISIEPSHEILDEDGADTIEVQFSELDFLLSAVNHDPSGEDLVSSQRSSSGG